MIIGDNIFTTRDIAMECEILKPDKDLNNAVVEGVTFRNYTNEEMMEKIEMIWVMAKSSPFNKLFIVLSLKQKGHVVAVIGVSRMMHRHPTNDSRAPPE